MPIRWSQTIVATFSKICMGFNKWLTINSAKNESSKNMDNLGLTLGLDIYEDLVDSLSEYQSSP
jgi:hypothetical protein